MHLATFLDPQKTLFWENRARMKGTGALFGGRSHSRNLQKECQDATYRPADSSFLSCRAAYAPRRAAVAAAGRCRDAFGRGHENGGERRSPHHLHGRAPRGDARSRDRGSGDRRQQGTCGARKVGQEHGRRRDVGLLHLARLHARPRGRSLHDRRLERPADDPRHRARRHEGERRHEGRGRDDAVRRHHLPRVGSVEKGGRNRIARCGPQRRQAPRGRDREEL